MTMMIGPLLLFAATYSPAPRPAEVAKIHAVKFVPTSSVTARASASVRIISGVRFGPGQSLDAPGAAVRASMLIDQDGQRRSANILEFQ